MNASTYAGYYNLPVIGGAITGATETALALPYNQGTAILYAPTATRINARPFRLHIVGTVQSAVTNSLTIRLYYGQSPTLSEDFVIVQPYPISLNGTSITSGNFLVTTTMLWDYTSTNLNGNFFANMNGNFQTPAALQTNITGIDGIDCISFLCSVQFGSGDESNAAYINEFSLEMA